MDAAQALEDLLEQVGAAQKDINKLKTVSVSGSDLRKRIKDIHKAWLPIAGFLEGATVDAGVLQEVQNTWLQVVKLTNSPSPKKSYKPLLKEIAAKTEAGLLHPYIKGSAIQTVGTPLRKLVQPVGDADLLKYLDESVRCAENNCIRASVVLAWCAVAHKIHKKLISLGLSTLNAEFARMKADKGLMFRNFTKDYNFSTESDIQEAADAHLVLLCRFLSYIDDTQYKHLRGALDLRNGCGHPTGYQPDAVKLQAYYADIAQLVLLNPKLA